MRNRLESFVPLRQGSLAKRSAEGGVERATCTHSETCQLVGAWKAASERLKEERNTAQLCFFSRALDFARSVNDASLREPPSLLVATCPCYHKCQDLVANVCHDGKPERGTYKVQARPKFSFLRVFTFTGVIGSTLERGVSPAHVAVVRDP